MVYSSSSTILTASALANVYTSIRAAYINPNKLPSSVHRVRGSSKIQLDPEPIPKLDEAFTRTLKQTLTLWQSHVWRQLRKCTIVLGTSAWLGFLIISAIFTGVTFKIRALRLNNPKRFWFQTWHGINEHITAAAIEEPAVSGGQNIKLCVTSRTLYPVNLSFLLFSSHI